MDFFVSGREFFHATQGVWRCHCRWRPRWCTRAWWPMVENAVMTDGRPKSSPNGRFYCCLLWFNMVCYGCIAIDYIWFAIYYIQLHFLEFRLRLGTSWNLHKPPVGDRCPKRQLCRRFSFATGLHSNCPKWRSKLQKSHGEFHGVSWHPVIIHHHPCSWDFPRHEPSILDTPKTLETPL